MSREVPTLLASENERSSGLAESEHGAGNDIGRKSDDMVSRHDDASDDRIVAEEGAAGAAQADAFTRLLRQDRSGRTLLVILGILIWLSMLVYALDNGLTGNIFTPIIGSLYGRHSQISAVTTASR